MKREVHPINLLGTVKLHGTNVSVVLPDMQVQSKNRIITQEDDHYGFADFVYKHIPEFIEIYDKARNTLLLGPEDKLVIYGEWAGEGIQQKVAISELPKTFFPFNMCIIKGDEDPIWIREWGFRIDYERIKSIRLFRSFTLKYHPDSPGELVDTLTTLTDVVVNKCPVAAELGVEGIGEGIVWSAYFPSGKMYNFKVKGDKHAKGLTKRPVLVVPEVIPELDELVKTLFTEERFNTIFQNGEYSSNKDIGSFIKDVYADVYKEEEETIAASGFNNKRVASASIKHIKKFIMGKIG